MLRVFAREPDGDERAFDFPDGTLFDGSQFRGWGRADWGDEHWNGGWSGRHGRNDHDADRRDFRDDHDSGEFLILSAQYGTERRHVDVTHRLRELAHNDIQFRMDNHTFGIDPDYGHRKVLRIYARDPNGRERMFEYPEHGWVDGSGHRKVLRIYARDPNGRERMFEYPEHGWVDGSQFRGWGRGEWGEEHERWSGRWNVEEHEREEHDRR